MSTSPFRITNIRSVWGEDVELPEFGVLCIVGANNVGKSQFLREIPYFFDHPSNNPARLLISNVEFELSLDKDSYEDWFAANVTVERIYDGRELYRSADGHATERIEDIGRQLFEFENRHLGQAARYFIHALPFESRSQILSQDAGAGNFQVPGSPLNRLFRNPELELELSRISRANFGFPLILDRFNGNVQLRVSSDELSQYDGGWYTGDYARDVFGRPSLTSQGDGVKNYIGIALNMLTTNVAVTLLDEPEAFLHPAQSRGLGRFLGQTVNGRKNQLVIATHDRDLVIGLLDSSVPLTVLRLGRDGDVTSFKSISARDIREIWSNPFLRFSNLLQGLFHKVVVLCESDADCMWFSAVASHLGEKLGVDTNELLFVPGGGKSQLPNSLAALKSLGVRVFTVSDFDSLVDGETVAAILASKSVSDPVINQKLKSITKSVETNGSYKQAKQFGIQGLGQGGEAALGIELMSLLRLHDVIIIPVGELESFDRTIGGKSSSWVSEALLRGLHQTSVPASECISPAVESLLV